jgi:hypothetical protein
VLAAGEGLSAGVRETQRLIPLEQLAWDYGRTHGQIRALTDAHVAEVRRSIAAVPPKSFVPVTVVPADPVGACVFFCACPPFPVLDSGVTQLRVSEGFLSLPSHRE